MSPIALEEAEIELAGAQKAYQEIISASNVQEIALAWKSFLNHSQVLFEIFRLGSKDHNKSSYWHGLKAGERKKDPLLRYLHHARNAREHGIKRNVTPLHFNPVPVYNRNDFARFKSIAIVKDERSPSGVVMGFRMKDGSLYVPEQKFYRPLMILDEVTDCGETFAPPEEHLGKRLDDTTAEGVAKHMLDYARAMVNEAAQFVD